MANTVGELDAAIGSTLDEIPDDLGAPTPEPTPEVVETRTKDEGSTPSEPSPSVAPPEDKAWKDLLAKYNGDTNQAAKSYWETNNRAAQLARDLETARKELETLKAAPPAATEPEAPPASEEPEVTSPYVEQLTTNLRSLSDAFDGVSKEEQQLSVEQAKTTQEINRLVRKLATGSLDLDGEQQVRQKLASLYETYDERQAALTQTIQRKAFIVQSYEQTRAVHDLAVKTAKLEADREAEAERRKQAEYRSFADTYFAEVDRVALEGSPIHPNLRERWRKFAKVNGVHDTPRPEQIPAYTRELRKEFEQLLKDAHGAVSSDYAKSKAADVAVPAPDPSKAVAEPRKRSSFASKREAERAIDDEIEAIDDEIDRLSI